MSCQVQVCWCHVDPHPDGFFCSGCGCEYPLEGETPRDLLAEAISIAEGTSLLLPQRAHLTTLWELYKLKSEALDSLIDELRK